MTSEEEDEYLDSRADHTIEEKEGTDFRSYDCRYLNSGTFSRNLCFDCGGVTMDAGNRMLLLKLESTDTHLGRGIDKLLRNNTEKVFLTGDGSPSQVLWLLGGEFVGSGGKSKGIF